MDYTREDYRTLYNDDERGLSDLTPVQKMCMVVLCGMVLATGFVEHENVSVMQEAKSKPTICPRFNAEGQELKASMVLETYVKGAPKPHTCVYGSKT